LGLAFPGTVFAMPLDLFTENFQGFKMTEVIAKVSDGEAFCSVLGATQAKLSEAVETREKSVSDYVATLPERLEDKRNGRDAKREEARSEADQVRSEWYARLEKQADGDDEEESVTKYQKTVEEAIDDRRDAVDGAIAAFRKDVDALAAKRSAGIQSTRDTFQTAVETAVEKLAADCGRGVKTEALIRNFKTALAAARNRLALDKKAATALETEVKASAEVRRKSISAAEDTFRSELKQANEKLQQDFMAGE
ncbi:MAG: hypothetical protein WAT81_04210, partial [Candidatus Moraniibacteriota bacterium]